MKIHLTLLLAILITSCSVHQVKTGQRLEHNRPSFYLSISPSFDMPYEYEVISKILVLREYSGSGGYDWGKRKEIYKKKLTEEQEVRIRELAIIAIKESIEEEQKGDDIVVLDGTRWYILTDYDVGAFLSVSTNKPSDGFYALSEYMENIVQSK